MNRSLSSFVMFAVLGMGLVFPLSPRAQAQVSPTSTIQEASTALQEAKQGHLWRVAAWGGLNTLGGLALVWGTNRSQRSARWNFAAMSAGWGAVNVGIATVGLLTMSDPPTDAGALLTAERQFHDILLFNLGLNVAYSAVGGTMLGAGYRDVTNAGRWRGFGTSLILQGAGLLVLDGIVFFASRTRLAQLLAHQTDLTLNVSPSHVALTFQF